MSAVAHLSSPGLEAGGAGIVAFAFGAPDNIGSNRAIGLMASQKGHELHAPGFAPWTVHIEFRITVTQAKVASAYELLIGPPSVLIMARDAVAWAQKRGLTE